MGENMRICFLEGDMSRKGGTERMTAFLANALSSNHEVLVLSRVMQGKNLGFTLLPEVKHRVLRYAAGKLAMLVQIREIRRILKREAIDAVINVDTGMGIYGIFACAGTKRPVITWEHSNFFNNWNSRIFPWLRRFAARFSTAFVVLTELDKRNYEEHIPAAAPVYVIPNPMDKKENAFDPQAQVILSAGHLLPIKQFDKAVEAAAELLLQHPGWKWVICGEGPERRVLEEKICSFGLSDRVFLPGSTDDMDAWYKKAAVFVLTSKMEGLPMVLLEAKATGLPLVSFDIMTGPSDLIVNNVNGFLVPADDVHALASKISLLIEDASLRKRFSDNAHIGIERFERNNIILQWETLLRSIQKT